MARSKKRLAQEKLTGGSQTLHVATRAGSDRNERQGQHHHGLDMAPGVPSLNLLATTLLRLALLALLRATDDTIHVAGTVDHLQSPVRVEIVHHLKNFRENKSMFKLLLFSLMLSIRLADANAANESILDRLNREERTWHKGLLFSTAGNANDAVERSAVLDWLRSRVILPDLPDSRYALTYSMMLNRAEDPGILDTANAFAVIGYAALQIDTARCGNRKEALTLARPWYATIHRQISALKSVSDEKRRMYWKFAKPYLVMYATREEETLVKSSSWICVNLPSHIEKIRNLPDTIVDVVPGPSSESVNVYIGNPSVGPDLVSAEEFESRFTQILKEIEMIALEFK